MTFRASSIRVRDEDYEFLRGRVCARVSIESKCWMLEATEGELWVGERIEGGKVERLGVGVWQILRMLNAWVGELGLLLRLSRPGSRED